MNNPKPEFAWAVVCRPKSRKSVEDPEFCRDQFNLPEIRVSKAAWRLETLRLRGRFPEYYFTPRRVSISVVGGAT